MDLTDGTGVDHVVETVGGANLDVSLGAVRLGGNIAFVGVLQGVSGSVNTYEFVTKNATIYGIESGSQEMYDEMADFIDRVRLERALDAMTPTPTFVTPSDTSSKAVTSERLSSSPTPA